ncbi:hypothetical protein [Serpentinicella alkaliphila]|uniref:Uncharacterized protein n=1 Tax=Serpentinicella alkaliphila TaxID=1734049 RepID=A0A4R2SXQ1_9FIRM|nr:hypothetical protein [Serpentinicella alkaliphila]QUH25845.1 hypothetical protein HZR23_08925 [Serpentinicella alkaliphila]TCP95309.1 hypothetical protein EDD79_106115 [Serpentinicella alkaliphila]
MRDGDFKDFLKNKGLGIGMYYTSGKALGLNAIHDLIKWGKSIERVFGVDLDSITKDSNATKNLLRAIQNSDELVNKQKSNLMGTLKAYYEFVNGNESE